MNLHFVRYVFVGLWAIKVKWVAALTFSFGMCYLFLYLRAFDFLVSGIRTDLWNGSLFICVWFLVPLCWVGYDLFFVRFFVLFSFWGAHFFPGFLFSFFLSSVYFSLTCFLWPFFVFRAAKSSRCSRLTLVIWCASWVGFARPFLLCTNPSHRSAATVRKHGENPRPPATPWDKHEETSKQQIPMWPCVWCLARREKIVSVVGMFVSSIARVSCQRRCAVSCSWRLSPPHPRRLHCLCRRVFYYVCEDSFAFHFIDLSYCYRCCHYWLALVLVPRISLVDDATK